MEEIWKDVPGYEGLYTGLNRKEYTKKYRKENKEYFREYNKKYYQAHKNIK